MTMLFSYMTDRGKKREKNEDCVYADGTLFIIADGMGGHNAGEVASRMAVDIISKRLKGIKGNRREEITDAVAFANGEIYKAAEGELSGMGTTADVCIFGDGSFHIGHVGDSRVYLLRDGELAKITVDHSYVEMLLSKGEITREQADNYPMKNMITRAVGAASGITTDYYEKPAVRGDILLMCTDGLTNAVSEKDIKNILESEKDIKHAVKKLIDAANANGGPDNITVIAAVCE